MNNTETTWLTRYGVPYESEKAGLDNPSKILDINPAKGTARFEYLAKCGRCGGQGGAEAWKHTGWVCYECGGSKYAGMRSIALYTPERLAKLNAAQAKRDAKKAARVTAEKLARDTKAAEDRKAFRAEHPDLVSALESAHSRATYGDDSVNPFLADLGRKLEEYGSLSTAQIAAAQTAVNRQAERAAKVAAAKYVGEIGQRIDLILTCEMVFHPEVDLSRYQRFAPSSLYICRDAEGNRITYRGTGRFLAKAESGKFRATIESHDDYRGEPQTRIARPKAIGQPVAA